jgi:hypothetical protein
VITGLIFVLVAVPAKIDKAIKQFKYINYASLTPAARSKAAKEDLGEGVALAFSAEGLSVKDVLDRKGEADILFVDWVAAAATVVDRTRHHLGDRRGDALESHHRQVQFVASQHGSWSVAREYDIKQRSLAAENPLHDYRVLNPLVLQMILSKQMTQRNENPSFASSASYRRPARDNSDQNSSPRRRDSGLRTVSSSSNVCFRCGFTGHLPAACEARKTSAGKDTARRAPAGSAKSPHALLAPGGKQQFCFRWAQSSSCNFTACRNFHGCSICTSSDHGAGLCPNSA